MLSFKKILASSLILHSIWLLVIVFAVVVRYYQIDAPLADWHSWRQADTASVTREFVTNNYPIWEPHFHDLSNIPSGLKNPEGYRMVEFPLLNYGIALILKTVPDLDLVKTSRIVTIFFSIISIIALERIVTLTTASRISGIISMAFLAFLPFSIYYSRVILPEPVMVTFSLLSIWTTVLWARDQATRTWLWFSLTWLFLALALLLKPTAIFFTPAIGLILYQKYGFALLKKPQFWLLATAGMPMLAWREWITQFPAGIPASDWLFNGNGIRLKPAWWRWLFGERLGSMILGNWLGFSFVAGILSIKVALKKSHLELSKSDALTVGLILGSLAYLIIFATGNVQHDYYQVPLLPLVAVLLARGTVWLYNQSKLSSLLSAATIALFSLIGIGMSWYTLRGNFLINNPAIVIAGEYVDMNLPPDAKVIAPYQGDTAFLFQTNRHGWPIGGTIDQFIEDGATHYVTTINDDEARALKESYRVLEENDNFSVIELTAATETTDSL